MTPHDPPTYFEQDNWSGGHFGVLVDLGPVDDGRLLSAFRAVFGHAQLHGPLGDPYGGAAAAIGDGMLEPPSAAYGEILLEGRWIGCIVSANRSRTEACLLISIPTGMLETIIEMPYPTRTTKALARVERAVAGIIDDLHRELSIERAILGEELTTPLPATSEALAKDTHDGFLLAESLWTRLATARPAELLPHGMRFVRLRYRALED